MSDPCFAHDVNASLLNIIRSQISDGAAATILARRSWAEERGLKPLGNTSEPKLQAVLQTKWDISRLRDSSLIQVHGNRFKRCRFL